MLNSSPRNRHLITRYHPSPPTGPFSTSPSERRLQCLRHLQHVLLLRLRPGHPARGPWRQRSINRNEDHGQMESSYNLQPFMNSCSLCRFASASVWWRTGSKWRDDAASGECIRKSMSLRMENNQLRQLYHYIILSYYIILSPVCLH